MAAIQFYVDIIFLFYFLRITVIIICIDKYLPTQSYRIIFWNNFNFNGDLIFIIPTGSIDIMNTSC